jgi:hypothetical protein
MLYSIYPHCVAHRFDLESRLELGWNRVHFIVFIFVSFRLNASGLPYADANIRGQKTYIMNEKVVLVLLHTCLYHAARQTFS